jgi:hypothetical protein
VIVHVTRGRQHADPDVLHLGRDPAEDRVRVFGGQIFKPSARERVKARAEERERGDAAGHDAVGEIHARGPFENALDLAHAEPDVCVRQRDSGAVGRAAQRQHGDTRNAGFSRRAARQAG